MNYAANCDGNLAALHAYEREQDDAEQNVELAVARYGSIAQAQLREEALNDAEVIREVIGDLSDADMQMLARSAASGDYAEIGRMVGKSLANYIRSRETEQIKIERLSVQMMRAE